MVEAVRCVIDAQTGLIERNADAAPDKRVEFARERGYNGGVGAPA